MKSVEFCYWLQGVFEVCNPETLNAHQTDMIKRHLNLVFIHEIDPSYPEDQQKLLNEVHHGPSDDTDIKFGTGGAGPRPRC